MSFDVKVSLYVYWFNLEFRKPFKIPFLSTMNRKRFILN